MTLYGGDLTVPSRVATWLPNLASGSNAIIAQLIGSMSALIYSKLSRSRLYSQTFVRTFDGVGNYQIVLPDYPVISITAVQVGSTLINPYLLPNLTTGLPVSTFGYGYRFVPWNGNLPGDPVVVEFVHGTFWCGVQNIQITYVAGYQETNEPQTIPSNPGPWLVPTNQPQGIWSRDNGVVYASTGLPLTPIAASPAPPQGFYVPPNQNTGMSTAGVLGQYVFSAEDAGLGVLISYSFIPADLEEACIQMVAERYSYRSRVGILDQSLGGQETIRYMRGGGGRQMFPELPPEVEALIWPYVFVGAPAIGAPV